MSELEVQKRKKIEDNIERRCQMIDRKQDKMLISLLDKPTKKIQLDRLINEENGRRNLVIKPAEVLKKTKEHYQNQFRSRHFDQNIYRERWEEIYKPKEFIKKEWYKDLNQDISEAEWNEMLQGLKKKTAPGISGIIYTLIQAAGAKTHEIFRMFVEICIKTGIIPEKWKISQIYPIPKEEEWHYNLSNVRPIALLETFRKCTTKILTKRLARIFCQKNILRGPNFAELPENSTEEPVHIINMLMEDAKESNRELWLVFQDMKKAFDSVSLTALKTAMERIKLPEITIRLILNLFQGRQFRIITHW